jgi:hypothetical protein
MRAAPAVSLSVRPSPHWRAALALLAAVALGSTVAWAWQRGDALSAGAAAAVGLLALHVLRSARRRPPLGLRWDGQAWWLSEPGRPGGDPRPGEVVLALDLGAWLLLAFHPHAGVPGPARRRWLPLQRAGLEADWHALRCALYSPRPAAPPADDRGGRRP